MTRRHGLSLILPLLLVSGLLLPDCGESKETADAGEAAPFTLSSPAFPAGGHIPAKFGCETGGDYQKPSIPLEWSAPPAGTRSLVLLVDDPAPVAKYWVHWLLIDLPPTTRSLAEGASGKIAAPARERINTFGETGYGGPCPPDGPHAYRFQLFAMPAATTSADFAGKRGDAIRTELMKTALGSAEFSATFP